jgi:hypothetical protein
MGRCKDKFQMLTFPLTPDQRRSLEQAESDTARRSILSDLWASDAAKDATVDKIRCAFAFDSSYRSQAIPEEEGVVSPYSPEPNSETNAGSSPAAQTPYAPTWAASTNTAPQATPGAAATSPAAMYEEGNDVAKLRAALAASEQSTKNMQLKANKATAQVEELRAELSKATARLSTSGASPPASGAPAAGGGVSFVMLVSLMFLAFAAGVGASATRPPIVCPPTDLPARLRAAPPRPPTSRSISRARVQAPPQRGSCRASPCTPPRRSPQTRPTRPAPRAR